MPHGGDATQQHDPSLGIPCCPVDMVAVPGTAHSLLVTYVLNARVTHPPIVIAGCNVGPTFTFAR